jgi:hypothetical protein
MNKIILSVIFTLLMIIFSQQLSAKTQFEFYYLNKPEWNSTVYLVEGTINQKILYKWILYSNGSKTATVPEGVKQASSDTEAGDWGNGVVTRAINKDLDIGEPLRMCIYGSQKNFTYQDDRCEYSSVSKYRIALVQIDLSPK